MVMAKLIIKTQKQLVELITSHTKWAACEMCGKSLGKIIVIEVDAPQECVTCSLCNICYQDYISLDRYLRFWRLAFRILRVIKDKYNELYEQRKQTAQS